VDAEVPSGDVGCEVSALSVAEDCSAGTDASRSQGNAKAILSSGAAAGAGTETALVAVAGVVDWVASCLAWDLVFRPARGATPTGLGAADSDVAALVSARLNPATARAWANGLSAKSTSVLGDDFAETADACGTMGAAAEEIVTAREKADRSPPRESCLFNQMGQGNGVLGF
jgi:hypothetical protein